MYFHDATIFITYNDRRFSCWVAWCRRQQQIGCTQTWSYHRAIFCFDNILQMRTLLFFSEIDSCHAYTLAPNKVRHCIHFVYRWQWCLWENWCMTCLISPESNKQTKRITSHLSEIFPSWTHRRDILWLAQSDIWPFLHRLKKQRNNSKEKTACFPF